MPPFELLLATRNPGKRRELEKLLQPLGIRVIGLEQFPDAPVVEETGETFADNARLKAAQIARATGHWTLGEDSGLMVDALGGRPGPRSARYSGPDATDERNNAKLIEELAGIPAERRGAQYVCHIAVADPEGRIRIEVQGRCRGRIIDTPRGTHGFGYDPHFLIPEYHKTFGELAPVVKNNISHRARALQRLLPQLQRLLAERSDPPEQ
ncbi:MAG: RdgB/HAM1 family non-canonical purine NTP pyrophosphatase [Planctomycetota bacterium]|nr:MAG: RdgB/HAM1 family non-canonical purine NTP pyrophosphatase [Planctomycetota bacterium]